MPQRSDLQIEAHGEAPGHAFRGNQHVNVGSALSDLAASFDTGEIDDLAKRYATKPISEMSQDEIASFANDMHSRGYPFEENNNLMYPVGMLESPRLARYVGVGQEDHTGHDSVALGKSRRPGKTGGGSGQFGFAFVAGSVEDLDAEKYQTYGPRRIEFSVPRAVEFVHFASAQREVVYDIRDVTNSSEIDMSGETHGEGPGHKFRGNQHTGGIGGSSDPLALGGRLRDANFKKWFGDSKVVNDDGTPRIMYHGTYGDFDTFDAEKGNKDRLDRAIGPHFAADPSVASSFVETVRDSWSGRETDRYGTPAREGGNVKPVYLSIKNPKIMDQSAPEGAGLHPAWLASDEGSVAQDMLNEAMPLDKERFARWYASSRNSNLEKGRETFDRLESGKPVEDHNPNYIWTKKLNPIAAFTANLDSMLYMMNPEDKASVVRDYKRALKLKGYDGIQYTNTSPMETEKAKSKITFIAFDSNQIKSATGNSGSFSPDDPRITHGRIDEDSEDYRLTIETLGEGLGHAFRGNQHTGGIGGSGSSRVSDIKAMFSKLTDALTSPPSTRARARADAEQALRELEITTSSGFASGQDMGSGVKLVSADVRIPDTLKNRGWIDLRGQEIKSPRDLAVLARVYRDPRFETYRIFYTDPTSKIVAAEAITSRMPDSVRVFSEDPDADIAEFSERMKRSGANGYYLVHNHPGGDPAPSDNDIRSTDFLKSKLPGFRGHVILNGNKYGYIKPGRNNLGFETGLDDGVSDLKGADVSPDLYGPYTGEKVASADALAAAGDRWRRSNPNRDVFIAMLSSQLQTRAVMSVPTKLFANPQSFSDFVRGQKRNFGASHVVSAATSEAMRNITKEYVADGTIMDGIVSIDPSKTARQGNLVTPKRSKYVNRPDIKRLKKHSEAIRETLGASELGSDVEHEAEAAKVDQNPTPAQMESGTYRKGHIRWNGLDITIETPCGGTRKAKDGSWKVENMPAHYGYIRRTEGADGDHVDVYMGKATESDRVFIVDQQDYKTGEFDEHKVMLGFHDLRSAKSAYVAGFSDGFGESRIMAINEISLEDFVEWLDDNTIEPFESHGEADGHPFRGNQHVKVGSFGTEAEDVDTGVPGTIASSTPWRERDYDLQEGDSIPRMSSSDFAKAEEYYERKLEERVAAGEAHVVAVANLSQAMKAVKTNEDIAAADPLAREVERTEEVIKNLGSLSDLDASMGVTYWHEKMVQDPSLLESTTESVAAAWAHIGGDGPMRVRWAAQMAFGLDENSAVAFDSKKGRVVQIDELSDQGSIVKFAAMMRHEYDQTQSDLEDDIEMGDTEAKSDEDAYEEWTSSSDYDEWRMQTQDSDWDDLSSSDKAQLADRDDVAEWADENEEIVGSKPKLSSDITETLDPSEIVSALAVQSTYSSPELAPSVAKIRSLAESVDKFTVEEAEAKSVSDSLSKKATDIRRLAQEAVWNHPDPEPTGDYEADRKARLDAIPVREAARDKVLADLDYESVYKSSLKSWDAVESARGKISATWVEIESEIETAQKTLGFDDDDFVSKVFRTHEERITDTRKSNLDDYYDSAASEYADADPHGKIREAWMDSYETPDDSEAYHEWKSNQGYGNGGEGLSIASRDWPVTLYRNVSADVSKYVSNFVESWSAKESAASQFGSRTISKEIEKERVLVYQGSKFWKAEAGGMGTTEFEFMLLAGVPKWIVARMRKQAKAERHGEGPGHPFRGNQYKTVWHGSPHVFDEFRSDDTVMGTGEGAQAYGHGLYLAEQKDIAGFYQKHLSEYKLALDGRAINPIKMTPEGLAEMFPDLSAAEAKALHAMANIAYSDPRNRGLLGAADSARATKRFYEGALDSYPELRDKTLARIAESDDRLNLITKLAGRLADARGHIYEVGIEDDVIDKMLNWDEPISAQHDRISSVASQLKDFVSVTDADGSARHYSRSDFPRMTGGGLYDSLTQSLGSQKKASEAMFAAGITGIRYLDASSRSLGSGTRNFVVFDPKSLKVLSRDGEPVDKNFPATTERHQRLEMIQRLYSSTLQDLVETHGEGPGHPFRGNQHVKVGGVSQRSVNVVFEVAPDPRSKIAAPWMKLPHEVRTEISRSIAEDLVGPALEGIGIPSKLRPQVGSYENDTNPSFALRVSGVDPLEVGKAIGHGLSQDSVVVTGPRSFKGSSPTGAISVDVGSKTPAEIDAIYQKLREIKFDGGSPVNGQSTVNGRMIVLNYSKMGDKDLALKIDEVLGGAYDVSTKRVYAAFPEKKDYDYASARNDGRGSRRDLRGWAHHLRGLVSTEISRRLKSASRKGSRGA